MTLTLKDRIRLITYSALIVVLLALIIPLSLVSSATQEFVPAIPGEFGQVEAVRISNSAGEVTLEKTDGVWTIVDAQGIRRTARTARVEDLLSTLGELSLGRVVASAAGSGSYGLGEDEATAVVLAFPQGERTFRFGGTASSGNGVYFQRDVADTVYEVPSTARYYLNQTDVYWTELRFWPEGLALADILTVSMLGFGDEQRSFARDASSQETTVWLAEHDEWNPDQTIGTTIAQLPSYEFASLEAADDPTLVPAADENHGIVTIGADAGRSWTIVIARDGETYTVRLTGSGVEPRTGTLASWRVTGLFPSLNPAPDDAATAAVPDSVLLGAESVTTEMPVPADTDTE